MTEGTPRPKKVVRRVVKRTVVRPGDAARPVSSSTAKASPTTGRSVSRGVASRGGTAGARPATRAPVSAPTSEPPTGRRPVESVEPADPVGPNETTRQRIRLRERLRALRDRGANAFRAVRDGVASLHLPTVTAIPAVIVSGLVAGLVVVGLASAALALFSWWLGVAAGGGWGFLAFCLITIIGAQVSAWLLRRFGHEHPSLVSYLGAILTIVVLLVLLLDIVGSRWALIVVPVIAATMLAAAHGLVVLAESQDDPSGG